MGEIRPRRKNRPRRRREFRKKWLERALYVAFAIAVIVLVAGAVRFVRLRPAAVKPEVEILRAGQAIIRQAVNSNLKANFSDLAETTVESLPERKWRLAGWVDLIDPYGHIVRQNFSLRIYRSSSGSWTGEDVFITPQM